MVERGSVGVIGVGQIGGGVAASLIRAGRPVHVYDVLVPARDRFQGLATVHLSSADVARSCDIVISAVVDANQLREVLTSPHGLLKAGNRNLTVVSVSTITVGSIQELARIAEAASARLIDCGVTGGKEAAQAGELVCLIGGPDDVVAAVKPVVEDFSSAAFHLGPLGAGIQAKIARNLITYGMFLAAYEGSRLARAAGIDIEELAEAIRISDVPIGGAARQLERGVGVPYDPAANPERHREMLSLAGLAHKDLHAAIDLGKKVGVATPLASLVDALTDSMFGLAAAPTEG